MENDIIFRDAYTMSADPVTKFADWVAYRIDASTVGPTAGRNWRSDPQLDEEDTLEPGDFSNLSEEGYDRGHQAPLAGLVNADQWWSLNFMSNITPQQADLNQGPWERLESAVRGLVQEGGYPHVQVYTGPLYESTQPELPRADEDHIVPSGYWKIVIWDDGGAAPVAWGFAFAQLTPRRADFCEHQEGISEISQRSGISFPGVPTAEVSLMVEEGDDLNEGQMLWQALGCELETIE